MTISISDTVQATTAAAGVAPGPATGLIISAVTTSQFNLAWTAPSVGSAPLSYKAQFRVSGSSTWTPFPATGSILTTSATITGLQPNTQYEVNVVTSNGFGSPSTSSFVAATTAQVPPSAPTLITATTIDTASVSVGWTPGSGSTPEVFAVSYRTPPGSGAYTAFGTTASTPAASLIVTGLTQGAQYEFEVSATNQAGSATSATTATATTKSVAVLPSAPSNLTVGNVTVSSIQVSWTPPAVGTTPFTNTIQVAPTGTGKWATAGATTDPTTTFTIPNLNSGTTYDIRIYSSNQAGNGPFSPPLTTSTTSSGNVRHPWLQPGSADSMWNKPFGSGAVWSKATDPDTLSARKANTINASNFGAPVYVATATDPLVTFKSSATANEQRDAALTVTIRCPANARPAEPYPGGDCQLNLFDPTTDGTKMWNFGPCTLTNGIDVTGGVTAYYGEVDAVCGSMEDALTGNFGYNQGIGVIRAWELDANLNPSGLIQHGLRFACDPTQILPPPAWDTTTFPDGTVAIYWPQTHVDYNGPKNYTGKMPGGATLGIPSSVAMPAGLSAGGQMLWKNAQTYGWHWRDTASAGITLYAEPSLETNSLLVGMRGDFATIVANLCVLRNQGPTSVQGGGTAIATPPPPIDPAVCGSVIAPGLVTGVAIVSTAASSVSLSWTLPTGSLPLDLIMRWSPSGTATWTDVDAGNGATTGTVNGLTASTAYDFEIYAKNTGGSGAASAIVSATTPSSVVATFDPATSSASVTLTNGNLTGTAGPFATGKQQQTARSTISHTTGKWIFEVTAGTITSNWAVGICNGTFDPGNGLGADINGVGFYPVSPIMAGYFNNVQGFGAAAGTAADVNGAIFTVAFDAAAQLYWVTSPAMRAAYGAAAWNDSGTANPGTGVGGLSYSGLTGAVYAVWNTADTTGSATVNFGASAFSVAIPTGFSAFNKADAAIVAPGQVTGLSVTSTTANSAALTWIAPSTGTAPYTYKIEAALHGQTTWTQVGTSQQTSGTASSLTANTSYDFRVSASNSAGTGAVSATATASTMPSATTGPQFLPAGELFVGTGVNASQIVDANNVPVRIASIGWNGGNGTSPGLEGLDTVYWQQTMKDMVRYGFNCIRILTCDAAVIADAAMNGVDYTLNPDLQGLTYLGVLDKVFDYAATLGLRIIIDSHVNDANGIGQQGNGLWYDKGGASNGTDGNGNTGTITDALFLSSWQTRATRWKAKTALLGYDIRNEPCAVGHASPGCTWGGYKSVSGTTGVVGSTQDIRDMYQRVGNAIQAIDSRPLIICEALIDYPSGAYAGDLRCVNSWPVTLTTASKVYYSIHEYPSEVGGYAGRNDPGGLGSADSGSTYVTRMQTHWGFLISQNIAPVWVGEMGDTCVTTDATNWGDTIVPYLNGTASGGITLSGNQQGVGWDWWVWAVTESGGTIPDFGVQSAWGSTGLPKQAQQQYWGKMLYTGPIAGGPQLVSSPLVGTVTTGTWTLESINGLYYWLLLPAQFDATKTSYPVVLYLHQLDQGTPFYTNGKDPTQDLVKPQIDPWFNNVAFRTAHPSIIIAPMLDQTADQSGNTINWGGIDNTVQSGQDNAIAAVKYIKQKYNVYSPMVFVTGNSMGGDGSWDIIIKYNNQTGTVDKIFAAALCLAGVTFNHGYPTPDPTVVSALKTVPVFAIHGGNNDTNSPIAWDEGMWTAQGGSTPYPGPNGKKAPNATFWYLEDPNLSHDVWDTYYSEPTSETFWSWLFSSGSVASAGTRQWSDQGGTLKCVWNIPLGDGCLWGSATDPDTIDLRHGGFINDPSNYGACFWISTSASDPLGTFAGHGADYETPAYYGSGTPLTVTAHVPAHAYGPGPVNGGDSQFCFCDPISNPGTYYHFAPLTITDFAAGTYGTTTGNYGGSEDAFSDTFATDWETGHANNIQTAGIIRGYDLDPTKNPARMPGSTTLTKIQHMFRYAHDANYLKPNARQNTNPDGRTPNGNPDYPNGYLNADSWPQLYQDYQNGVNVYKGNLVYGTTVGIPKDVVMPATNPLTGNPWTDAGKQIWWTFQNYGGITRDQSGGGLHLAADQTVPTAWRNDANTDLAAIVGYLCPLRNQHQGGQSYATYPINGPGNRLDSGPAPLAALGSPAGTTVQYVGPVLYDAIGEAWGLTGASAGSFSATINGTTDTRYPNIIQLLYYNGSVYEQRSDNLWYYTKAYANPFQGPVADPRP